MRRIYAERAAPRANELRAFYVVSRAASAHERSAAAMSARRPGRRCERRGGDRESAPGRPQGTAAPSGGCVPCTRGARRPPLVAGRHRPCAGARRRHPAPSPGARDRLGRRGTFRPAGRARSRRAAGDPGRVPALAPPSLSPPPPGAKSRPSAARCVATRYAAILDLQEQVKGALIARAARGTRHGPDRASIREPVATLLHDAHHRIDPAQHLIDRCRQLAAAALGYPLDGPPRFGSRAAARDRRRAPEAALTSCSSTRRAAPTSCGPKPTGARSSSTFAQAGFAVLLPWGSRRRARAQRTARGGCAGGDRAAARRRCPRLAGLLARAELVVGVDTGLVHLAAALGTPTLALFIATDPALAGVARASPRARDLGASGQVPALAEVQRRGRRAAAPRAALLTRCDARALYAALVSGAAAPAAAAVVARPPRTRIPRARRRALRALRGARPPSPSCGSTRCRWEKRGPRCRWSSA